jgi:aspartate/methionine/tyrosine aminotransferase
MTLPVNPLLQDVEAPPISEAMTWAGRSEGNRSFINLSQAVPSYPPSPALQEHVARVARDAETSLYSDIAGLAELRKALAGHMSESHRGDIDARDVLISAGCNQAFCLALMAIARSGDNIILPAPFYFNHQMWLTMQGIEAKILPTLNGASAIPSAAEAARLIDERTRAIILVTPNNPTGAVYPASSISEFFELAQLRDIALVVDETYKDFRSEVSPPHDIFTRPDWRGTFVQLYSFSKVYALTGYRVGSVVADEAFLSQVEKIMDCVSICAPRISQEAALFGLQSLASWREGKRAMMAKRLEALRAGFGRPGLKYQLVSAGAYFAYIRHPFRGVTGKSVARRLAAEQNVLCLPGSMFGPDQEQFLRLAFANVEADLMDEVVDRLIESQ